MDNNNDGLLMVISRLTSFVTFLAQNMVHIINHNIKKIAF